MEQIHLEATAKHRKDEKDPIMELPREDDACPTSLLYTMRCQTLWTRGGDRDVEHFDFQKALDTVSCSLQIIIIGEKYRWAESVG